MCVDGGGASHWVLIPAMFRVDADVFFLSYMRKARLQLLMTGNVQTMEF
jgi:hypothetical protein